MAQTPPDAILVACLRWLQLLRTCSRAQANAIIGNDPAYADLTRSQYVSALEWLDAIELGELDLSSARDEELRLLLAARTLQAVQPIWMEAAEGQMDDPPAELAAFAHVIGVAPSTLVSIASGVARKVDVDRKREIGLAGELALVTLLSRHGVRLNHVSMTDDSLGFDAAVYDPLAHLEIKTTTSSGRLRVYLSRHEADVASTDKTWHLVVVSLRESQLRALATVRREGIVTRLPQDTHSYSRWESVRLDLGPDDLVLGLPFLGSAPLELHREIGEMNSAAGDVAWLLPREWQVSVEQRRL